MEYVAAIKSKQRLTDTTCTKRLDSILTIFMYYLLFTIQFSFTIFILETPLPPVHNIWLHPPNNHPHFMSLNPQIDSQINGRDEQRNNDQQKVIGCGKRAKRLVFSKINKVKKRLQRNKTLKNENLGFCCCWCVGGLPSRDSATESPTSDPNDSGFGLRGLIEKSDFLLDECNTHLDVYISDAKDDDDDDSFDDDVW